MGGSSPVIHVRRPVVVSMADVEWTPSPHLQAGADKVWERLCHQNPHAFDGRLVHVAGVHRNGAGGATVQVFPCAYRWYAAQVADPQCDLGCRPLGVKGYTLCEGKVLLGRRASWTMYGADLFEFAPSGGVEPGSSAEDSILREFNEEAGGTLRCLQNVAVIFDEDAKSWEIIFRIETSNMSLSPSTDEYQELEWFDPDALPDGLTPIAERMRNLGILTRS